MADGDVRVIHGDCLAVLPTLAGEPIAAVITDPPYGVGKADWDDEFPTAWIPLAWSLAPRMLVMPGNRNLIVAANAIGRYRDLVCLRSLNGMTRAPIAFGKMIPVLACGDWAWRAVPNVLEFAVRDEKRFAHPSIKPIEAMIQLIGRFTSPGDLLLDPFAGSGTTGVAALKTGRRAILIEKDARYIPVIERRIAEARTPLFDAIEAGEGR